MSNLTLLRNNFSSGEIDPELEGRVELGVYQNGCRTLENFLPMKKGGFRTIPGSYYLGAAAGQARLIPWYGKNNRYVMELSNTLARFWKSDHTLHGTTVVTPYSTAEMGAVQWRGINNDLHLVHAGYAPRKFDDVSVPAITTPTFTGSKTFAATGAYPSIIGLNQGRLVLGATDNEPNGLFQSRAPTSSGYRLTDFTAGSDPDYAIFTYQADGFGSRLRWVQANRRMAAGADMSLWADAGGMATPASFYMDVADFSNAAPIQAAGIGRNLLYIGSGERPSLHLLLYSQESGGMVDLDLTEDAGHILEPGVVEIAVQVKPFPVVWVVRTDGQLVGCTLNISPSGISVGWGRRKCADGGLVESACVLRQTAGDEVHMSVNRGGSRQIEYFAFKKDDDFTEIHYVDNGLRLTPASATVTGLAHLNGKTVHAIADGSSMPEKVVAGGQVTYDRVVQKIHIGQPYQSDCIPERPEIGLNTTWFGKKKRVEKITVRLHRSFGGRFGAPDQDPADMQKLTYPPFVTPEPFTGDKDLGIPGPVTTDGAVRIIRDDPFPLTVLAISTRIAIMEP